MTYTIAHLFRRAILANIDLRLIILKKPVQAILIVEFKDMYEFRRISTFYERRLRYMKHPSLFSHLFDARRDLEKTFLDNLKTIDRK